MTEEQRAAISTSNLQIATKSIDGGREITEIRGDIRGVPVFLSNFLIFYLFPYDYLVGKVSIC